MILREHFPLRLRRFRLFATLLLALTSPPGSTFPISEKLTSDMQNK